MNVIHSQPLAQFTTFNIGGAAKVYIPCTTETEIIEALEFAQTQKLAPFILSGGSNVLIADSGYDGCVIHVLTKQTMRKGAVITVAAGVTLLDLIQQCHGYNLGGWECLAGIPGSIGGAVRGNVGAFGGEIASWVTSVTVCNIATQEKRDIQKEACEFSYRSTWFKENPEWVILSATFTLEMVDAEAPQKAAATIAQREKRHLQNVACAGSYFMNPVAPQWVQDEFAVEKGAQPREGRVPAGWLIEKVGLRGYTVGNAASSAMHANYLVNNGGATAAEVRAVAGHIQDMIQKKYMTYLHEEPTLVGFHSA